MIQKQMCKHQEDEQTTINLYNAGLQQVAQKLGEKSMVQARGRRNKSCQPLWHICQLVRQRAQVEVQGGQSTCEMWHDK